MIRCPNCGAENPQGSEFCGLCHYRFEQTAAAPCEWSADVRLEDNRRPSRKAKKKAVSGRTLVLAGTVLVCAILAVVLYYAFFRGSEAAPEDYVVYNSPTSGLSFKYPSSWEKKDPSFLQQFYRSGADVILGNEIIVIKRGETLFRHMFIASSSDIDLGEADWKDFKGGLQDGFIDVAGRAGAEVRFTDLVFQSGEAKGFKAEYALDQMGSQSLHLEAVMLRRDTLYRLILETPLLDENRESEARTTFFKLVKSVSLK